MTSLILHLVLIFLLCSPTLLFARSFTGLVTRVIDGDTVCAHVAGEDVRIRLADIDAPEMKQLHGVRAREFLVGLVAGKEVRIDSRKCDRYGRLLATLRIAGLNVNELLVRTGHAWRYRYARKTGIIAKAETHARDNRLGLWHGESAVAPWIYRKN